MSRPAEHRAGIEVAVAVPAAGTFHYLVPDDLTDRTPPGMRVLVPFGARQVTGYVLACLEPLDIESRRPLKEIIAPLDDEPLFGPDLIPFFRFVADYYHYPIGQVVAEALPAGLKTMSLKTLRLTRAGKQALDQGDLSGNEAKFLARLDRPQGLTLSRLIREKTDALKLVRRFEARGWLKIEVRLGRDRVRARIRKWLHPIKPGQRSMVRLGPKERELLDLLEAQGPSAMDDLRDRFPTLAAMSRRLEQKGMIEIEERTVYRDALGRAMHFNPQDPELTAEQAAAVSALALALDNHDFSPYVLHGVTGSGKTEVYLAAARLALTQGRTALMLVPEISLTPAFEGLLRARFQEEVAVIHSGLSDGERYDQWLKIRRRQVRLVLGARSAIFAPLQDLGLIVVDEEHDGAYKQEEKLRYQARDMALYRGRLAGAVVVLGSATPSLESYYAARQGRYGLLTLAERVGQGELPRVDVVDLRFDTGRGRRVLTPMMKKAIEDNLAQGRQVLLFINRRGLAGLPICLACGFALKCLNCSVTLTLHHRNETGRDYLNCHHCGFEQEPPDRCPECNSRLFRYMGVGTERLEKAVQKAFPSAAVGRLDADTARAKGELTRILEALRDRKLDVLVGTQMVTKGHDFPGITLVGVIEADLGLHLPDFRSGERTFQLLAQVGGRAGRGADLGRVIVQTYSPDHYTLMLAKRHDFPAFFEEEIEHRRESFYPPFSRLILVRFQGNSEKRTGASAERAANLAREMLDSPDPAVDILGPAPAPLSKVKGKYRFQILVRSGRVRPLHRFLHQWLSRVRPALKGQGVALSVDVDPYHMM